MPMELAPRFADTVTPFAKTSLLLVKIPVPPRFQETTEPVAVTPVAAVMPPLALAVMLAFWAMTLPEASMPKLLAPVFIESVEPLATTLTALG